MDEATRELTARAAKIVSEWKPSVFGAARRGLERDARELIDALTPGDGCEPLLAFLWLPNVDQAHDVVDRVVAELARRPDAVEPLLRICRAGYADEAAKPDAVAAHRADETLWAMALDDVVPALVRVACGDGDAGLREDALGRLSGRGPEVVPALDRLASDEELGRSAARCLAQLEEHDMVASGGSPEALDDLVYAYREASTDEDAEYALGQLIEALEDNEGVLGARALAPVREYIRECVEGFMGAEDEDEEDAALDELEVFAGACGDLGARLAREEVARVPVTEGTRRLHEASEALAPPSPPRAPCSAADDGTANDGAAENRAAHDMSSSIVGAAISQPAAELQALTRRQGFRRLRGKILEVDRRPAFLQWERPAALPPLGDPESHEAFIFLALMALYNDPDEEFQAIAALSLLGDRAALPLLRLLEAEDDDAVGTEWVRRVIGWDTQLAEAEGVDLSTWAATPGPRDDELAIDELRGDAPAPAAAGEEPGEEAMAPAEEAMESGEEAMAPAEPAEPRSATLEPIEPPGLASMDEAFDDFLRRMEREQGG